jgi:hypothetical protein
VGAMLGLGDRKQGSGATTREAALRDKSAEPSWPVIAGNWKMHKTIDDVGARTAYCFLPTAYF